MTDLPMLKLADVAKSMGVSTVYGESMEIDGTTVVPVALVAYGFGAGGDGEGDGGGGGGGYAIPVGAYVGDSLGVRFLPNPVAMLAVGVPFAWAVGHALARILKALKK